MGNTESKPIGSQLSEAQKFHTYGSKPGTVNVVRTCLSGKAILNNPLLNKGTAFTKRERELFDLCSLLPYQVNTLDEQLDRVQGQFDELKRPILKNGFMQGIHDQNETLFYSFILRNLKQILPIIYTPTEGEYIKSYSHVFHRPRGVYLNYPESERLEHVLLEATAQNDIAPEDVDLIVVTDSEEILGIGDQGVGGIAISAAKLVLYTAMGGINPARVLPVALDVGTNNDSLINDPLYLGWRHERVRGKKYDDFVEQFVTCVRAKFKNAFLHWEDFGVHNARRLLTKYQPTMATFNDDIQGTGAITLACIMAALKVKGGSMEDQIVVIFGTGSAGCGIADNIRTYLETHSNLSKEEAAKRIWCIDKPGLLTKDLAHGNYTVADEQQVYARSSEEFKDWEMSNEHPQLLDVVKNVKPTVLIGCSTVPGAFTEEIVRTMAEHCDHPIIFPLSNPTQLHEAKPVDLFEWTQGKVFVATGSPFDPVEYDGKKYEIAECNNSFVFPGIGLGCVICRTKICTDQMIFAAADAISECSPSTQSKDRTRSLLPDISEAREVSVKVASAIIRAAEKEGHSRNKFDNVERAVREFMWEPKYAEYELMHGKNT